jgi:hypothetical protein
MVKEISSTFKKAKNLEVTEELSQPIKNNDKKKDYPVFQVNYKCYYMITKKN